MKRILLILILEILYLKPSHAYLDTTPSNFTKPKPIKSTHYEYKESQYTKYVNVAAEKVAPKVFGSLFTGPTSTLINIADKAVQAQEKREAEKAKQLGYDSKSSVDLDH